MPSPVPTPVAAALGLVPTVLDGVRRLPGKAVQIPVLAVSSALTALDTARREYDELAERGELLLARLRGTAFDQVSPGAPDPQEAPDAEAPKGVPTPKATEPSTGRVDTAATQQVVDTVELVVQVVDAPAVDSRADLPLADYDHMTLGSLRGRLRSLSIPELVQVREYELEHADRLPVVTMLDNRIAKLATDATVVPSPGGGPVVQPAPDAGGKVPGPAAARTRAPRTKVRKS